MLKAVGIASATLCGVLAIANFAAQRESAPRRVVANDDLVQVVRRDVRVRLTVIGDLRPSRSTTVSSTLAGDKGTIVFLAEDGAVVEEGDVLVRLDRAPFEEAVRVAEIDVSRKEGMLTVRRHALDWERSQASKSIKSAEYEVELADLEKHRFEKGEGPLELARLKADSSAAQSALAEQELFVSELEPLLEQGFVQQAEIDQLVTRRDEAKRSADLARQQAEAYEAYIYPSRIAALGVASSRAGASLDQVRLSSASKVAEAQAALDLAERDVTSARARLEEARRDLERTTITAPTNGMLVLTEDFRNGEKRKPRIGDTVWQGQQIAFLPDLGQFEVESRVREVDLHKIAPGHRGEARVDAYPGLSLEARVRGLGVLAERGAANGGEKSFSVAIDLVGSDERLRPGMTARVEIDSGDAADVLVVPVHALWEEDGDSWCWLATDAGLVRRDVVVGLRDHHHVEIASGLTEGDRVSLVGPDAGADER